MTERSSHVTEGGAARMVDVGGKGITRRTAAAGCRVVMNRDAFAAVLNGTVPKGDVYAAARIAGIMAAKKTPDIIPLCHPLQIEHVTVDIVPESDGQAFAITAAVSCAGKTGVEMEALTAAAAAALTMYDMCKSLDKSIEITGLCLLKKSGGRTGEYIKIGP